MMLEKMSNMLSPVYSALCLVMSYDVVNSAYFRFNVN